MNRLPTLSDAVATHAALTPNKLAARDSRRAMTFAELNQRAQQLAEGLLSLELNAGDRVGVLAYNCVEWVEIYVALARVGLVAVPINFRLTGPEVAYILGDAEVRAVIAGVEFCELLESQSVPRPNLPARALHRFLPTRHSCTPTPPPDRRRVVRVRASPQPVAVSAGLAPRMSLHGANPERPVCWVSAWHASPQRQIEWVVGS